MTAKLTNLPSAYDAQAVEQNIYSQWEKGGYFLPKQRPDTKIKKPFVISLPPPNATGTLHLGHAMMLAIEDLMIRYHRLRGDETLWVPGTDHAAIATQNVMEKKIWSEEKKTRHDLGREELLRRVEEFVAGSRDTIRSQMRRVGASLDWSRERYTLDEGLSRCVRLVFKMMYDDGLIYRGNRVVNWCNRCQTTLADDEVEYHETTATLYTFCYSKDFPIAIASTRPETKLGDTAVAVHPDDERYKQFVGQTLTASFAGKELTICIVADPVVEREFGTGAVGVTPAHSQTDAEIAERHKLPVVKIIGEDGRMTAEAGPDFAGLKITEAREKVVAWLRANDLIEKEETVPQNLTVCYRCETPVEPLVSKQWFVAVNKPFELRQDTLGNIRTEKGAVATLKVLMQNAVESGQITILPDRFRKIYLQWIYNLRDWCISRQIWFGHRIPVWYCLACNSPTVDPNVKSKWFLVRHGESAWNKEGRSQGQIEDGTNPLTKEGTAQAERMAHILKEQGIGLIISSDLKRCKMVAEIIAKITGAPIIFDKGLRERHLGEAQGMIKNERDEKYGRELLWGYETAPPGGETWKELETRVWRAFQKIKKSHHSKNVVIVSHGGVIRSIMKQIKNWDPDTMLAQKGIENAEIVSFEILSKPCSCGSDMYEQDPDTLDTWFSSGLWTFSTLLKQDSEAADLETWRAESPDLKRYHPTSVLETGYDILFFWVARMVLMTTYALGEIPFRTVYLHGLVRDKDGRKMSKSLDNVIDPVDMIEKYGADAVRLSLVIGTTPGNDIRLYEEKIAGYRNFVNKLWNISRFILTSTKASSQQPAASSLADRWILAEFEALKKTVAEHIDAYRFSAAGEALYEFTWSKLADWYVEAAKFEKNKDAILRRVLKELLVLWHPFTPFVTEYIWQLLGEKTPLIAATWPATHPTESADEFDQFRQTVTASRDLKHNFRSADLKTIKIVPGSWRDTLTAEHELLQAFTRLKIDFVDKVPVNAPKRVLGGRATVFAEDVIVDTVKLASEKEDLQRYVTTLRQRLENGEFRSRAPAAIVKKEEERLKEAKERLKNL